MEREVRFTDKNKALEMLAKHQGMFIDRQIVLQQSNNNISKMSEDDLKRELAKQIELANTINISPVTQDNHNNKDS